VNGAAIVIGDWVRGGQRPVVFKRSKRIAGISILIRKR
jgi:hypothetical protein